MMDLMSNLSKGQQTNNLTEFKTYIDSEESTIKENSSAIKYTYNLDLNIYQEKDDGTTAKINPSTIFDEVQGPEATSLQSMAESSSIWEEMLDNQELLDSQYDLIAGNWPQNYNEVVLVVDKNNQLTDYELYSLGLKDIKEFNENYQKVLDGETVEEVEQTTYSYEDLLNLT